jgi:hypothetical protein
MFMTFGELLIFPLRELRPGVHGAPPAFQCFLQSGFHGPLRSIAGSGANTPLEINCCGLILVRLRFKWVARWTFAARQLRKTNAGSLSKT